MPCFSTVWFSMLFYRLVYSGEHLHHLGDSDWEAGFNPTAKTASYKCDNKPNALAFLQLVCGIVVKTGATCSETFVLEGLVPGLILPRGHLPNVSFQTSSLSTAKKGQCGHKTLKIKRNYLADRKLLCYSVSQSTG